MGEVSQHAVTFLPALLPLPSWMTGIGTNRKSAVQDAEQKLQKAVMPFWSAG